MNSYQSLKNKHALTGVYSLTDNSNVCAELASYAQALDLVCGELEEMYRECFVNTALDYGLSRREQLISAVTSHGLSVEQRREILCERLAVTSNDFTLAALEKLLSTFGADFSITESPQEQRMVIDTGLSQYTSASVNLFVKNIGDFVPAHLEVEIVYSGRRWNDIDSLDTTFEQLDAEDYTWAQIDAL